MSATEEDGRSVPGAVLSTLQRRTGPERWLAPQSPEHGSENRSDAAGRQRVAWRDHSTNRLSPSLKGVFGS